MRKTTEFMNELLGGNLKGLLKIEKVIFYLLFVLFMTYVESFKFAWFYMSFFLMTFLLCRLIYILFIRIKNKGLNLNFF